MKKSTCFWKVAIAVLLFSTINGPIKAKDTLQTRINPVNFYLDGKKMPGGWHIMVGEKIDPLDTKAREIMFVSDIDSIKIVLEEWQSKDFSIINEKGERAPVRVTRVADNIYEKPNPKFVKRASNGKLSREQAEFDIRALVYGLSEIHPDIFSSIRQVDFFRAINEAIESLPDSVTTMELYRRTAPIVAMIGDGHTNLNFPFNDVFTRELKRMPFLVDVLSDKSIICRASLDSIIPSGARILSINGMSAEEMVNAMLPYVAGEREHFKLSRVDHNFPALRHMLFPADAFEVVFLPAGAKKQQKVTYQATLFEEVKRRIPALTNTEDKPPYSFEIDKAKNVAIMDFREFSNVSQMERFADSLFQCLRNDNIGNLIIDLRNNGGGNSTVGDVLLRYISPKPFKQMDKALVRISPLTIKLTGDNTLTPGFFFYETSPEKYIVPRKNEEGHYNGHVILLTSNNTFSSAGSFAWAFKECGIGTVIGEETGGMNVCYGDILSYRLPVSGLVCSVSYKRFWQLHADENDIHGTIPHVAVPAAQALDKAMEIIRR